ncbi:MAG TPA: glycosyltransferase family 2 protein, partial [Patescibacteria group bacterium]|nr:glycosyltransferase family 2 protein [Patescibacteria group bacterium]
GKKWLKRFFASLSKQTYKNVELILIDNGSTDGSIEFVKKYFPKVKIVVNKKNYGLAKATNIGVKNSHGKYILFMNNDTWVDKNFIDNFVRFYESNRYQVISAAEKRYYKDTYFKCNTTIDPTGSPAYFKPTLNKKKLFYLTVCFFCTKEIFESSGGLDEDFFMYYEDVDWFWRLSLQGRKFAMMENNFIHHAGAGSTGGGIKYNTFLWRNQNTLQTLIKNYSLPILIVVLPVYFVQNLVEILFFLLIGRPKISQSYVEGWIYNLKKIKKTLKKREWVQKNRVVNDLEILRKMYMGFGKYLFLKDYFEK